MAHNGKVPIGECVNATGRFFRAHARAAAPAAAITAALMTPVQLLGRSALSEGDLLLSIVTFALGGFITAPLLVGLFRAGERFFAAPTPAPGQVALALDRDSVNVGLVNLLISFLMMVIMIVGGFTVMMVVAVMVMQSGITREQLEAMQASGDQAAIIKQFGDALGTRGQVIIGLMAGALLMAMAWMSARLVLAGPASAAQGRVLAFSTWTWTKGNGLGVLAVLALVGMIGLLAVSVLTAPLTALTGANQAVAHTNPVAWVQTFLTAFGERWLVLTPFAGLSSYLYRGLRPAQ
jgi:hypothetical protein